MRILYLTAILWLLSFGVFANLKDTYINNKNCDKILHNQGYFTTCYNYKLKSAIMGHAVLDGKNVNKLNIKKRPKFYDDENLDVNVKTYSKDYTHSGFDRSHQFSDASFDYSIPSQKATYVMSNVLPHYPNTNRRSILKTEEFTREMAVKYGSVEVFIFHKFTDMKNPLKNQRIGKSQLSVPVAEYKYLYNKDKKFKKCFYIPNDNISYTLENMSIDCDNVEKQVKTTII